MDGSTSKATLLSLLLRLLCTGYGFKVVAGVLQGDLNAVDWSTDLYHHFVGVEILVVYLLHHRVLSRLLQVRAERLWSVWGVYAECVCGACVSTGVGGNHFSKCHF